MNTNDSSEQSAKEKEPVSRIGEYNVIGINIYRDHGTVFINGEEWVKKSSPAEQEEWEESELWGKVRVGLHEIDTARPEERDKMYKELKSKFTIQRKP